MVYLTENMNTGITYQTRGMRDALELKIRMEESKPLELNPILHRKIVDKEAGRQ